MRRCYEDNVNATVRIARYAHARGVYVEAELGKVGGKDGAHAPGVRTDPQEAVAFVAATNVDALAVAVGSSHAMTAKTSTVDMGLIAALDSRKYITAGQEALVPEVARLITFINDGR